MSQKCFASISDTGRNCVHLRCIIDADGCNDTVCTLHQQRCEDMGYICDDFAADPADLELKEMLEQSAKELTQPNGKF